MPTLATKKPFIAPNASPTASATTMASAMFQPDSCNLAITAADKSHHRRDREVDLAADDDEGHDQRHDRFFDAELEEICLVLRGQKVRTPA